MARYKVIEVSDLVCGVRIVGRWVADGLFYGCGCEILRQNVGFGKDKVSIHVRLQQTTGGDGEIQSD